MVLHAQTASDLMMPNPHSIGDRSSVEEAVVFLTDKGFSAAPVIDDAGRPVGVVSQSDILRHERHLASLPAGDEEDNPRPLTVGGERLGSGFHVELSDQTAVRAIMTAGVLSVGPKTPAAEVIAEMLDHKIHRLFVVDDDGILVGVISVIDVLRHLR
jgi:CBS domain-containing protein